MTAGLFITGAAGDLFFLQKALRIDVVFELEIALVLGTGGKPLPQIGREIDIAERFHEQTETVAALDHGERSLGGAQHPGPFVERWPGPLRKRAGSRAARTADNARARGLRFRWRKMPRGRRRTMPS